MRQPGTTRAQSGVTLLELVIVLAAGIILSSIAIPGFMGYIERARVARAVGDIGTLSVQLYKWQLNTGSFPVTLAEAGIDAGLDPWGNPYAYQRVEGAGNNDLRKDHNLHPINTDFDLYSLGADGDSVKPLTGAKSRDDVIRANDGSFIGLAIDY